MRAQDNIYDSSDTRELLNPTFTEASTRANINSGESHKTILGKIKKWFSSLGDLAFLNKGTGSAKFLREDGTWQTDNNTTYTFTSGTNKFTVKPSSGDAFDVTVTPSITNNITGSGTSGYIAKFNGSATITNGPAFGSDTTKYLRNDGSWVKPPNDNTTYSFSTGDGNGQIKITPSSGSAYNISVKGLGNLAYISKDSSTSHYLRGDGSWVTPPDTDTKVDNTVWQSDYLGAKHKRSTADDYFGFRKNDGTTTAYITYENGNIATPGTLAANGGITTTGNVTSQGDIGANRLFTKSRLYFGDGGGLGNIRIKSNGYPCFTNGGGEDFPIVVGDGSHIYKLTWNGSRLGLYIDNVGQGWFNMN